ncbi:hypothetical protein [Blautia wexlerae]
MAAPDAWVDICLDKSRIRHYQGTDIGRRMAELGHVTLRMVKVPLPDNKEEILITNLPSETFDHLKIAELYLMRWNKEGYFSQSSGFFYDNSSVICRNYRKCMGIMQNRV